MNCIIPIMALVLLAPWAEAQPELAADPMPIRRVALAKDALPPASAGPLVAISQQDFDRRLRAAAKSVAASSPRLLAAQYAAALVGNDLAGDAEWQITSAMPGSLILDPLNLAIANPQWGGKTPATLDRTPTATRLAIEEPGPARLTLNWSARGREEPGVLRFDLRLPAVPIAALDLDLPEGRTLAAGDALLAGPLPSPKPQHSRWRIAFGGKSRLELVVRNPAGGGGEAVRASRTAKYDFNAAQATATFDFDLETLRGPASTWSFRVDPEVRVVDVVTPHREAWQFDAARREVIVTLHEPQSLGHLSIATAIALPLNAAPWHCSGVHAIAASGDDSLELRIGSDVKLEAWEPGDYLLTRTAPTPDRGYTLFLHGSWRSGETARKPPSLTLRPALPDLSAKAKLDWQLGESNRLAVGLNLAVLHGLVTQFALKLPAGYTPGPVHLVPVDPAATVSVNGTTWTLEPSHPWATGQTIELRLDLRGPPGKLEANRSTLPVPRLTAIAAIPLEGTFTITADDAILAPLPGFERLNEHTLRKQLNARDGDAAVILERAPPKSDSPIAAANAQQIWRFGREETFGHIDDGGNITAILRGTIVEVGATPLAIALPNNAVVESASLEGKWADFSRTSDGIKLPTPARRGVEIPFEVRYRLAERMANPIAATPEIANATWTSSPQYRFWPLLQTESGPAIVMQQRILFAAVAMLATLLGILAFWLRRRQWFRILRNGNFALLLALGLALYFAPGAWPRFLLPLFAVVAAIASFDLFTPRRRPALAFAIITLGISTIADAQPANPATVYVQADGTVYAPRDLLDRLEKLASAERPAFAFTDAVIRGQDDDSHATFEITLSLQVNRDGEQTVTLPLGGLALESALLDGKPAFPVAAGNRFTLAVAKRGPHVIVLKGRVPLATRGADREVTLPLDPLPMARLIFSLGPTARAASVPNRDGSFRSERTAAGIILHAELGAASPAIVRWRSGGRADRPARVTASEATLWDIANGEASVTAAFAVRVEEGSLTRLAFDLPATLDPGRTTIRTADGAGIGVRDGRLGAIANGRRTYNVLLQEPLEGTSTVILRLVPLMPLAASSKLANVKLVTTPLAAASYLAVRSAAPVERWERAGFAESSAETLTRDLGSVPELGLDRAQHIFRREGNGDAWARPTLRLPMLPQPIAEEIAWQLGPRATAEGTLRFAKDTPAAMIEFEVPAAIVLGEVQAADLAGWHRQGSRVRVWFRSPLKDASVKWYGSWPGYPPALAKPMLAFDLPVPARSVPSRLVRLQAAAGYTISVPASRGWQRLASLRPGEHILQAATIAGTLRIEMVPARAK